MSLETKQRLLAEDRDLLAALTRVLIDPKSPLSAFSAETHAIRDQAVSVFRTAVEHPDVPPDLRDAAATAFSSCRLPSAVCCSWYEKYTLMAPETSNAPDTSTAWARLCSSM